MKKRRDQCIQVFTCHPGPKSDSWVGYFGVATGGVLWVAIRVRSD